jgi:hypothetical protein
MRFIIDQTDRSAVSRLTQRHRELKARVAGADDQNWSFFHLVNPIGSILFDRLPCYLLLATFCRRRVCSATPFARPDLGCHPFRLSMQYVPAFSDRHAVTIQDNGGIGTQNAFGYQNHDPTRSGTMSYALLRSRRS